PCSSKSMHVPATVTAGPHRPSPIVTAGPHRPSSTVMAIPLGLTGDQTGHPRLISLRVAK
ncbi:MAG: hypothetical protein WB509_14675, partial [Acetobacteraceae bacterium]